LNKTKILAVFDLDGTLTKGDSFLLFLKYFAGKKRFVAALATNFFLVALSVINPDKWAKSAKEALLSQILKGESRSEVDLIATVFVREILLPRLKVPTYKRLRWHQEQGHLTAVNSASLDIYIEKFADILDIDLIFASELEFDQNAIATGKFIGQNNRGQNKVFSLKNYIKQSEDRYFIWAYGNSKNDQMLLDYADIGIRVDKSDVSAPPVHVKS
jgi:phosphatidylglycerophosphatase C